MIYINSAQKVLNIVFVGINTCVSIPFHMPLTVSQYHDHNER